MPEFDIDIKKTRVLSGSVAEPETDFSDISDLSVIRKLVSYNVNPIGVDATSDVSTRLTLKQTDMQDIFLLIKDSSVPQSNKMITDSFQHLVTDLISSNLKCASLRK